MEDLFEKIRKKHGIEVIGKETCDVCHKEYDIVQRTMNDGSKSVTEKCPHCVVAEENKKMEEEALIQAQKQRQYEMDRVSRIPEEIRGSTFEDYTPFTDMQKQAKQASTLYANGQLQETSLVFQGDTGIGKTHLSYCIAETFKERHQTVVFIDAPELMNMIKTSFQRDLKGSHPTQDQIMSCLKRCDLLILDDIGAEYVKPDANGFESWAADIIFQIVNARQGKNNIYTTNYTSKELAKKYGKLSKRIISRMMYKAKVLKVDGEDQRLKGFE